MVKLGSYLRETAPEREETTPSAGPMRAKADVFSEPEPVAEPEDYELVMGRRQIASASFVVLVTLTVFSTLSYMAGRWTSAKGPSTNPSVVHAASTPRVAPPVAVAVEAPPVKAPEPKLRKADEIPPNEPPIFGEPVRGLIYLQMAAVDRGTANVMVNGLRRLGFPSMVVVGPSEHIFRVMVGPFANDRAANDTHTALQAFGLAHFAKKSDGPPSAKPKAKKPPVDDSVE